MIVSAGQLHSSVRLLELVATTALTTRALNDTRELILVCPAPDLLNLCSRCGWIEVDGDGYLRPSKRGHTLRGFSGFEERLREQLRDIIATLHPAWSKMICHGRHELARSAHPDVCQCFKEAGLLGADLTDSIICWWDEMANLARGVRSAAVMAVGRKGERYTLAYERQRTCREPYWQSVESAFSGYDVLSVVSRDDKTPMQIEVKATELRIKDADLHLSINEWKVAQDARIHVFHLWRLGAQVQHAIIGVDAMAAHVPRDAGSGCWESVRIPFRAFTDLFTNYPVPL